MCMHTHACMHACMWIHTCACMDARMHACAYTCVHVHTHACMHMSIACGRMPSRASLALPWTLDHPRQHEARLQAWDWTRCSPSQVHTHG